MSLLDVIDAELERIHTQLTEVLSVETRCRLLTQLETLIQFLTDHHKTIYIEKKAK